MFWSKIEHFVDWPRPTTPIYRNFYYEFVPSCMIILGVGPNIDPQWNDPGHGFLWSSTLEITSKTIFGPQNPQWIKCPKIFWPHRCVGTPISLFHKKIDFYPDTFKIWHVGACWQALAVRRTEIHLLLIWV